MINKLFLILLLFFVSNCVGVISKNFENYDPKSTGTRIRKTFIGPLVVFGIFHMNDSIDTKEALSDLRKINDCDSLKNIDIEFFNHNYVFVGYQKMIIHADCDKSGGTGGSKIQPAPSKVTEPDIGT